MATKRDAVVWDSNADGIDVSLFDQWDEAAEEAAIAEAAAAADVRYVIIGGKTFVGRFPDGAIVRAPLGISVADLEALSAEFDNPVDQVKALLERIGDADGVAELERQPLSSVVIFATRFFGVFEKIASVALGKLTSS